MKFFVNLAVLILFVTRVAQSADSPNQIIYLPYISTAPPIAAPVPIGDLYQGHAAYYYADGSGNCSFDPSPDDLLVAALNEADYGNADWCGAYAHVVGPNGAVTVRIVDRCPGCDPGHLDLSVEAFEQIADLSAGFVPITWQFVSPPLDGNISYHFKDSSSAWWLGIQIRNHRTPIASVEATGWDGTFQMLERQRYNYFTLLGGLGHGPYTVRVTDIFGRIITDHNVPLLDDATYPGGAQFPPPPQANNY